MALCPLGGGKASAAQAVWRATGGRSDFRPRQKRLVGAAMRVAFLLPDLRMGGAERATVDLARALAEAGHQPEFLVLERGGELAAEAGVIGPVDALDSRRIRDLPQALSRRLRNRPPDALVAQMWPLTAIAPLVARLAAPRCRVLAVEHAMLSEQYGDRGPLHAAALRASLAAGLRAVHAAVAVSNGVAEDVARLAALPRSRIAVIANPVPLRSPPSPSAIAKAERLWGAPRGHRILTVGRMKPEKNHELLLEAFDRLSGNLKDARLMLVGSGECETALRARAAAMGAGARIVFAGMQADPSPFYATADLFVLSSDQEGFGLVLVEALQAGLPVVATDCPSGPADILENGRHGQLVPVGDPDALAAAIQSALAGGARERCLGQARARDFAPAKAATAYLRLLGVKDAA